MDLRSRGAGSSADEDWVVTARAPPEAPPRRLPVRERLRSRRQTSATGYDAFISYSRVDVEFALRLQRSLERFAKPWNRTRALRVFRDMSSLAAT
jgi:hypothetical protein